MAENCENAVFRHTLFPNDYKGDAVCHGAEPHGSPPAAVEDFRLARDLAEEDPEEKERRKAEEEQAEKEKAVALTGILITSGFTIDGYKITKYSGYISGDAAESAAAPLSLHPDAENTLTLENVLLKTLAEIRRNAIQELKEAAYALGCNAVIGVDFDYLTLERSHEFYVICVTANGNAVVIEKIEED